MVKVCYLDRVGTENSVSCPLLLRIHGIKMHMGFNWKKLCPLLGNGAEATPRRSGKWSVTSRNEECIPLPGGGGGGGGYIPIGLLLGSPPSPPPPAPPPSPWEGRTEVEVNIQE